MRASAADGRRELHDILRTARTMEERRLNPFLMDVGEALQLMDRFFPRWEQMADLVLDARALNALSRVVKMQESRLRYQAQLFHADPEAMAEKVTRFPTALLGKVFLSCWHPVVQLEQLTAGALEEALAYWGQLEPVALRHRERPRRAPPPLETLTLDDLMAKGIVPRDRFGAHIAHLWEDLQRRGPMDYYAFIDAPTRGERVRRAYATSYLVTYGYAVLRQEPGKLLLEPRGEREPPQRSVSLPIVVPG
jgi:hypothetical protein